MKENDERAGAKPSSSSPPQNWIDQDPIRKSVLIHMAGYLLQGEPDGPIEVFLDPLDPVPALVCFFNFKAYQHHIRDLWLRKRAFEEICQQLNVEFNPSKTDAKAWEEIVEQRPDIAEKAKLLMRDPDFLLSFAEKASTFAGHSMQFIDPERIMNAVATGNDLLIAQATGNFLDIIIRVGKHGRRTAKDKHRAAERIVHRFNRQHMDLKDGRNGVKSKGTKCTYKKLEQAVCALCSKTDWEDGKFPNKKAVASRIGFSGANRDQTLGTWMRDNSEQLMQKHNHSTYKFRQVAKEILERQYMKPI